MKRRDLNQTVNGWVQACGLLSTLYYLELLGKAGR
jgi:hypothetical protein